MAQKDRFFPDNVYRENRRGGSFEGAPAKGTNPANGGNAESKSSSLCIVGWLKRGRRRGVGGGGEMNLILGWMEDLLFQELPSSGFQENGGGSCHPEANVCSSADAAATAAADVHIANVFSGSFKRPRKYNNTTTKNMCMCILKWGGIFWTPLPTPTPPPPPPPPKTETSAAVAQEADPKNWRTDCGADDGSSVNFQPHYRHEIRTGKISKN